ncbi:MAG: mycofactocin precursor [Acidimicrobiia bacterium]|jgi:mycofactocin precursor|nr:mycofactocin precursor [Acidimicrobiia bacterium]MDQ3390369.1 mycofactocin precursor MftA [Actinomycetota bacterium]
MEEPTASTESSESIAAIAATSDDEDELIEELLVEEISIDGMCGVY